MPDGGVPVRAVAVRVDPGNPAPRISLLCGGICQFGIAGVDSGVVPDGTVGDILFFLRIIGFVKEERPPRFIPDKPVVDHAFITRDDHFAVVGKIFFILRKRSKIDLGILAFEIRQVAQFSRPDGSAAELSVKHEMIVPVCLDLFVGEFPFSLFRLHKVPAGEMTGAVMQAHPVEPARFHRADGGLQLVHVDPERGIRRIPVPVDRTRQTRHNHFIHHRDRFSVAERLNLHTELSIRTRTRKITDRTAFAFGVRQSRCLAIQIRNRALYGHIVRFSCDIIVQHRRLILKLNTGNGSIGIRQEQGNLMFAGRFVIRLALFGNAERIHIELSPAGDLEHTCQPFRRQMKRNAGSLPLITARLQHLTAAAPRSLNRSGKIAGSFVGERDRDLPVRSTCDKRFRSDADRFIRCGIQFQRRFTGGTGHGRIRLHNRTGLMVCRQLIPSALQPFRQSAVTQKIDCSDRLALDLFQFFLFQHFILPR